MVTCKDCLHNHVCALWRAQEEQDAKSWSDSDDWDCDYFDDKSRFVELPCKVGDKLYYISCRPNDGKAEKYIKEEMVEMISIASRSIYAHVPRALLIDLADLGKTVFLTRKEAEAKLEERTGE